MMSADVEKVNAVRWKDMRSGDGVMIGEVVRDTGISCRMCGSAAGCCNVSGRGQ